MTLDRKSALVGLATGFALTLLVFMVVLLVRPASDRYDFKMGSLLGETVIYVLDRQTGEVWWSLGAGPPAWRWRAIGDGRPGESKPGEASSRPGADD